MTTASATMPLTSVPKGSSQLLIPQKSTLHSIEPIPNSSNFLFNRKIQNFCPSLYHASKDSSMACHYYLDPLARTPSALTLTIVRSSSNLSSIPNINSSTGQMDSCSLRSSKVQPYYVVPLSSEFWPKCKKSGFLNHFFVNSRFLNPFFLLSPHLSPLTTSLGQPSQ